MSFIRFLSPALVLLVVIALVPTASQCQESPSQPVQISASTRLKSLIEDLKDAIDDTAENDDPQVRRKFTTKAVDSRKLVLESTTRVGRVTQLSRVEIPWSVIKEVGLAKNQSGETHFVVLRFREKLDLTFSTGSDEIAFNTKKEKIEEQSIVFSKRKDARVVRNLLTEILTELGVEHVIKDID